jgi:putative glutamine amidotransferase
VPGVVVVGTVVVTVTVTVFVPPPPPHAAATSTRAIGDNRRMARPIIGITAYAEEATWGVWTEPAALIPLSYVRSVERAGGRALLVPPTEDGIEETLDRLDGLVFSGGSDVDPDAYGAEAHPATIGIRPERDRAELALLTAALERDMPVLAVCRGSQVLNVALGGDLEQHVPDRVGHDGHKQAPGTFSEHEVEPVPGTCLAPLIGERATVKSHHHQGYGRLGRGLRAAARAEDDTVEAIEDPARRFTVGVLWHPEEGDDMRLFEELVAQARAYGSGGTGSGVD